MVLNHEAATELIGFFFLESDMLYLFLNFRFTIIKPFQDGVSYSDVTSQLAE